MYGDPLLTENPAFFSQDFGAQGKSCEQTFLKSVWKIASRQFEKTFFFQEKMGYRVNIYIYLLYCFTGGFMIFCLVMFDLLAVFFGKRSNSSLI